MIQLQAHERLKETLEPILKKAGKSFDETDIQKIKTEIKHKIWRKEEGERFTRDLHFEGKMQINRRFGVWEKNKKGYSTLTDPRWTATYCFAKVPSNLGASTQLKLTLNSFPEDIQRQINSSYKEIDKISNQIETTIDSINQRIVMKKQRPAVETAFHDAAITMWNLLVDNLCHYILEEVKKEPKKETGLFLFIQNLKNSLEWKNFKTFQTVLATLDSPSDLSDLNGSRNKQVAITQYKQQLQKYVAEHNKTHSSFWTKFKKCAKQFVYCAAILVACIAVGAVVGALMTSWSGPGAILGAILCGYASVKTAAFAGAIGTTAGAGIGLFFGGYSTYRCFWRNSESYKHAQFISEAKKYAEITISPLPVSQERRSDSDSSEDNSGIHLQESLKKNPKNLNKQGNDDFEVQSLLGSSLTSP